MPKNGSENNLHPTITKTRGVSDINCHISPLQNRIYARPCLCFPLPRPWEKSEGLILRIDYNPACHVGRWLGRSISDQWWGNTRGLKTDKQANQSVHLISMHLLPRQQEDVGVPSKQIELSHLINIQARSINLHLLSFAGSFPSLCSDVPAFLVASHVYTCAQPSHLHISLSAAPGGSVARPWRATNGLTCRHGSSGTVRDRIFRRRLFAEDKLVCIYCYNIYHNQHWNPKAALPLMSTRGSTGYKRESIPIDLHVKTSKFILTTLVNSVDFFSLVCLMTKWLRLHGL